MTAEEDTGAGLSARNRLPGVVRSIEADGVMAVVELDVAGHRVTSVITRRSLDELGLAVGDPATAIVKSTSVMITRGHG